MDRHARNTLTWPWRDAAQLAAVAAVTAALAWLLYLAVHANWSAVHSVDQDVLTGAHSVAESESWLVFAGKALSRLTTPISYYVATAAAAVVLVWRRRFAHAGFLVVVVIIGLKVAPFVKQLVQRTRPVLEDPVAGAGGFSFPSGHAVGITVFTLSMLVAFAQGSPRSRQRRSAVLACLLIASVGTARIFLGVHFLSDVVAGILVGTSWVAAWAAVTLPVLRYERTKVSAQSRTATSTTAHARDDSACPG